MRFVVDKVALGQVLCTSTSVSPVIIILQMIRTLVHLSTTVVRRTSGRSVLTSRTGKYVHVFSLSRVNLNVRCDICTLKGK